MVFLKIQKNMAWIEGAMFTRLSLMSVKRKAMRKQVWFRVLKEMERALVNLTIRCVEVVRSSKLAGILECIKQKLMNAMESPLKKLMLEFGKPTAAKIAYLAVSWGNIEAQIWAFDSKFAKYLTVMHVNTPEIHKV